MNQYTKIGWNDHVSERPGTFREINNPDGTVTHIPEEGEILQEGTPVSANNLNHMDDGIYNANSRGKRNSDDIISLAVEVAILKNASLNNFTHNIFMVNFATLDSVELSHGFYDVEQKRLVI